MGNLPELSTASGRPAERSNARHSDRPACGWVNFPHTVVTAEQRVKSYAGRAARRFAAAIRETQPMDDAHDDRAAFGTAEKLLGAPLVLPLGPGEPPSGADFRRLATRHTFGDSWPRPGLDLRGRALVSVTIAATLGTREPLRG